MQIIDARFVQAPHIALISCATPVVSAALPPTIQNRLVLALIIGSAQGKRVFVPDHKSGPMAPRLSERLVQRVELRRRHADVDGTASHRKQIDACVIQELFKPWAQIVVSDRTLGPTSPSFRRLAVAHSSCVTRSSNSASLM